MIATTTEQLNRQRLELGNEIRSLAAEEHQWGDEDRNRWNDLNSKYDELAERLARRSEIDARLESINKVDKQEQQPLRRVGGNHNKPQGPSGAVYRSSDGAVFRAYKDGEQLSEGLADEPIRVGECIRSMLTNQYGDLSSVEQRAVLGGSDTQGGYLLARPVSSMVVDLARAASVSVRAGAQTLNMNDASLSIVRLTQDPTGYWRQETAAVTASNPLMEAIILQPKTLATLIPVSVEVLMDAPNVGSVLEMAIQNALGLKLDQAILDGAGSAAEPLGIRNDSNVNTIASVGTPTDYSHPNLAIGDVRAANYQGPTSGLAWINHPRTVDTYTGLKTGISSDNTPLMLPSRVAELQQFETTSIDTTEGGGSNEAYGIVGDFSQVLIGMRSQIEIRIAPDGTATDAASTTWNATTQLLRHFVAFMRVDVALLQPTFFTVLTGITA